MNIGGLAKVLMKKTVTIAGDGARPVTLSLMGEPVYDVETGSFTVEDTPVAVGNGLFGIVEEAELAKYSLTETSHKVVIPYLSWKASGARMLEASDRLLVGEAEWQIEKVVEDGFEASIIVYMCRP